MKLDFEKPILPNFIRTIQGVFKIEQLTEEEMKEYVKLWEKTIINKWKQRKELHNEKN